VGKEKLGLTNAISVYLISRTFFLPPMEDQTHKAHRPSKNKKAKGKEKQKGFNEKVGKSRILCPLIYIRL
jgi:hypothetical protein